MKSQQPDNQVNVLIAIVLSMAVLLGWSYFFATPQMEAEKARQARDAAIRAVDNPHRSCTVGNIGSTSARRCDRCYQACHT